jgi:hypothetical protein
MSESITIKIAARDFTVRRLTLRQSRAIGLGVARPLPTEDSYAYAVDQAIGVITAALSRDYKEMTADALLDAEITPKELMAISGTILEFSGFIKAKDASSGEAAPGAA